MYTISVFKEADQLDKKFRALNEYLQGCGANKVLHLQVMSKHPKSTSSACSAPTGPAVTAALKTASLAHVQDVATSEIHA